jgi:hypothetical protein
MAHDKGLENVAVHWPATNQYYDPVAPAEFVDFGAIADAPEIAAPTGALALHIARPARCAPPRTPSSVDLLVRPRRRALRDRRGRPRTRTR